MMPTNDNKKRMLLIDDDSGFCNSMALSARNRGLDLQYYESLQEISAPNRSAPYDVAIIDYDMDDRRGLDFAKHLPLFFGDLPLVLVSRSDCSKTKSLWPKAILKYVRKAAGPDEILREALGIVV